MSLYRSVLLNQLIDVIEPRAGVDGEVPQVSVTTAGTTLLPPAAFIIVVEEHSSSAWSVSNSSSFESLSFASWQLQQQLLPLCPREVIRRGHWVYSELPTVPYQPSDEWKRVTKCYGTRNLYRIRPWPTYFWSMPKDSNCRLLDWNVSSFCELMHGQTILVHGDSISHEYYVTLVYMAGGTGATYREMMDSQDEKKSILHEVCMDTTTTTTAAAAAQSVVKLFFHCDDSLEQLSTVLARTEPDVIVLNRGAHYVNDTTLLSEMRDTIHLLEAYQQQYQQQNNNKAHPCRIIWHTTPPGHPRCKEFKEAGNNIEAMEALVADPSGYEWPGKPPEAPVLNWWLFKGQNALVLQEFADSNLTYYDVIDGYDLMIRRPDLHKAPSDCLHSCIPGKVDVYPQLLLHYLSMEPRHAPQ